LREVSVPCDAGGEYRTLNLKTNGLKLASDRRDAPSGSPQQPIAYSNGRHAVTEFTLYQIFDLESGEDGWLEGSAGEGGNTKHAHLGNAGMY
jgi:hypothetical protein